MNEEEKKQELTEETIKENTAEQNHISEKTEEKQETELEKQTRLAKEYYDQLLRNKAEFENYRKRVERERLSLIQYGKADLLTKFLPMYDILSSAAKHLESIHNAELGNTLKGLQMIFKEFEKIFDSEGIRPMETIGKPYDPMANEILGVVDGDDKNDGLVVEELQKGFFLGDKILRPARVKIARKKAEPKAQENKEEKQN